MKTLNLKEHRTRFEQMKGKVLQIQEQILSTKESIKMETRSLQQHEKARELIREAGLKTQEQLQYHISDITSLALNAVFDDPYELQAEFVQRRNKTECDLYFIRDGERVDPMDASGGGTVDVAAFALRIASWSMSRPHSRPTFILDEPFKHVKGEADNLKVLEMIQEISKRMGIQIIMVSDEKIPKELIIANADKTFEVTIRRRISKVTEYVPI
jgi:DNA repair exonuclease SbcCD ATPase subunit